MTIDCKYLLDGKGINRQCTRDENMSCRYWGNRCIFEEQEMMAKRNIGQDSKVVWEDDDGYQD